MVYNFNSLVLIIEEHKKLRAFFVELMSCACDGENFDGSEIIDTAIESKLAHFDTDSSVIFDLQKNFK